MTLLFATFVVLYGLKPEGKTSAFQGVKSRIQESFVEVPEDIPLVEKKGELTKGIDIFRFWKGNIAHEPVSKRQALETHFSKSKIEKDYAHLRNLVEMLSVKKPRKGNVKNHDVVAIEKNESSIRLNFLSSLYFQKGQSKANQSDLKSLKPLLQNLVDLQQPLHIEGHTDDVPEKKGISKWVVSTQRANSVSAYLIKNLQADAKLLSISGYADRKPIARQDQPYGRQLNRRVEIFINYADN